MRKKELKERLEQTEKRIEEITRAFKKLETKAANLQKMLEKQQIMVDVIQKQKIKTQGDRIGRMEVKLGDLIKAQREETLKNRQGDRLKKPRKKHR